jgi:transcriptional regulator with XRE-family HTH domain
MLGIEFFIEGEAGMKLKQKRLKAGLTQSQLSILSNVPLDSLKKYEQGKRSPIVSNLIKIANALNCEIKDLI